MVKYGKTETIHLQGKVSWLKAIKPDAQYDCWSVQLHPNPDSLELLRDLQTRGIKNMMKKDEDGYYMNFKRPVSKVYQGKIKTFAPPVITDKDGNPWEKPVGNGSDATLQIEAYEHGTPGGGKATALRWVGARIDNLIPFDNSTDYPEADQAVVDKLKDQPEQLY